MELVSLKSVQLGFYLIVYKLIANETLNTLFYFMAEYSSFMK